MSARVWLALALVLAASIGACSGTQSKAELQNVAIVAGCKVSIDLAKGEAGAAAENDDLAAIKEGCTTALRVWDHAK